LADELISGLNGKWSMEGYFDLLCGRFGMDRVVSAIKRRCGKHTTVRLPSAAPLEASPVEVWATEWRAQ
jgi:hypothetical protein